MRHRSTAPVRRPPIRRLVLSGAGALGAVAAVSGAVAVGAPASAPSIERAAFSVAAAAGVRSAETADRSAGRSAAAGNRVELQRAAHRRELARAVAKRKAAAAVVAQRERAQRVSRDRERARIAARDPRTLARTLVAERGWGSGQYSCLQSLWTKESGWKHTADNPTSSAYGIPQALPGAKMASAGSDWRTNPATQIRWGLGYIDDRYGTPCAAWRHSQANSWY